MGALIDVDELAGQVTALDDLRAAYTATEGREVAAYCGSGVMATHTVFALHR